MLRAGYPAYHLLREQLPHRSLAALKHRVRTIGIAARRHIWTNREISRLRQAYADDASDAQLLHLFPGLRLLQIKSKAGHLGLAPRRRQLARFGIPALDAIRALSVEHGLSLVELDRRARTGRFFQTSCRSPRLMPIVRAAKLFGGDVTIIWVDRN